MVERLVTEKVLLEIFSVWTGTEGFLPFFEVLDSGHAALGVGDHLREEVAEAGAREFGSTRAVEVAVVDCFAGGGGAEGGLLELILRLRVRREAVGGALLGLEQWARGIVACDSGHHGRDEGAVGGEEVLQESCGEWWRCGWSGHGVWGV